MRITRKHDCSIERFVNALHNLPDFKTFNNWTPEECKAVDDFERYAYYGFKKPAIVYGIMNDRLLYTFDTKDSDAYLLNILWREDRSLLTYVPKKNYAIYWRPETNEEIEETKKCISLNSANQ